MLTPLTISYEKLYDKIKEKNYKRKLRSMDPTRKVDKTKNCFLYQDYGHTKLP